MCRLKNGNGSGKSAWHCKVLLSDLASLVCLKFFFRREGVCSLLKLLFYVRPFLCKYFVDTCCEGKEGDMQFPGFIKPDVNFVL